MTPLILMRFRGKPVVTRTCRCGLFYGLTPLHESDLQRDFCDLGDLIADLHRVVKLRFVVSANLIGD